MSIESFYVNITIEDFSAENLNEIFNENPIYQSTFACCWSDIDKELSIQATLVSFLPACELLFRLCKSIQSTSNHIEMETRRERHMFDFDDFLAFFSWFYGCWKERLENFNHDWGAFIVRPDNYYKARRRLRKKYMLTY